jgi:hypothetical protein
VFPNGFKDQGLGKICFGPSRTDWVKSIIDPSSGNAQAAEGDARVLEQNKDLNQGDLNQVDLMSRGDVRSSSAAMGAYPLDDELVIAEWRGLRPKSLALDQFGAAMTETFDRATTDGRELPEVAPIVTPTKTSFSAQQIREDVELRELDGTKVDRAYKLVLLKRVYLLGAGRDTKFLRFVDVTQAKGREAVNKGDFKDHFWDEMWPTFQFVFATLEEGDEVELSEDERAALTEEREKLVREDEEGEDDGEGEENGERGGGEDEGRENLEEGSGEEEEEEEEEGEEQGGGRQGETFRGLQLVGGDEEEEEEEDEEEEEEEEEESAPPQQRRGRKRKVETYLLTPQQVTQMLNVQPAALKVGMRFGSYSYEGEHNGCYIFQAAA